MEESKQSKDKKDFKYKKKKSKPEGESKQHRYEYDLFASLNKPKIRKSGGFPNSEIDESNCVKPSAAKNLFLQMDALERTCGEKPPQISPPRRQVFWDSGQEERRDQEVAPPVRCSHMCHCNSCCACPSPGPRLQPIPDGAGASCIPAATSSAVPSKPLNKHMVNIFFNPGESSDFEPVPADPVPGPSGRSSGPDARNMWPQHHYSADVADAVYLTSTLSSSSSAWSDSWSSSLRSRAAAAVQVAPAVKPKVAPDEFKQRSEQMEKWFEELGNNQKNLVLEKFLRHCGVSQTHVLSCALEARLHVGCPPNCRDRLAWLPLPLAEKILAYLDPVSLCCASATTKAWRKIASSPMLWQRLCCVAQWKLSPRAARRQVIAHIRQDGSIDWKAIFGERYRLKMNWVRGRCSVRTFEGHTQSIFCVQFDDTRIVSGSSDKTIKVWNIRANTPWTVQTLVGHSGTVRCLHLEGNRLVSGSADKTIKVWDLSMQQGWSSIACKVTMTGHTDTVRCLKVDDVKIVSGSYDKSLKMWDMRTGECRLTLRGHEAAVLCVQFDNTKIVSGSCDKTIKVWNMTGECLMTLQGHDEAVTCLQFDSTRIVSGSIDSTLKFWDLASGRCSKTIDWKASEGHTGVVRCLQTDAWRVVSASDDRTLKVWNVETGERIVTLRHHTDGVTCLQFNDNFIVSGSYDKTVKLWDFSSV